jgi:hypothetical protein
MCQMCYAAVDICSTWDSNFSNRSDWDHWPLLHIAPFCEGPNKKPEGFAKEKQPTIFAMWHASHLVVHHPSLIYTIPYNHRSTFATYTTKKTLRPAQSLSTLAIFHTSQRLVIFKTSHIYNTKRIAKNFENHKKSQACVIRHLAFCVWICIANLITNFYETFRWWTYRKLQCALARKLVKGLLEKAVSQKVSQYHLIYHGLF